MKNREAIDLLAACLIQEPSRKKAELYSHCIGILLKEEPIRVQEKYICPGCKRYFQTDRTADYYCPNCGQKLTRGEDTLCR